MTSLERLELILRQARSDRDWNMYTLSELLDYLIDNLTNKNTTAYHDDGELEGMRK